MVSEVGLTSAVVNCLDRPRVHRASDSGWLKFSIDSRATGAATTWTVAYIPGGAWPGRSAVQLAAGKCTRLLQAEGQQPTGGWAATVRGSEERPTARARWTLR